MKSELILAIEAFEAADDVLCAALKACYGKCVGDHRYYDDPRDSQELRDAKEAYREAGRRHSRAWEEVHARARENYRKQIETA